MKCNSCKMEWIDNEKFANIKKCPFCGEALFRTETPKSLSTMGDVLKTILEKYGENILRDKTRLINIFKDLAPNMKKESVILESAMVNHIEKYFIGIEQEERDFSLSRIRNDMGYFMTSEAIEMLICSFSQAFGWQSPQIIKKSVSTNDTNSKLSDKMTIKELRSAAEDGNVEAQCILGYMYEIGEGVEADVIKAAEWYRKAAEQGYAHAQCKLGYMFNSGQGVKQDKVQALEWYKKAVDQEDAIAQYNLAVMYDKGDGVEENKAQAVEWYRKAAEQGFAEAQNNLGMMYFNGEGIEANKNKAAEWFLKAAEHGYADAQYNLGNMYETGEGVEQNNEKALEWYKKAAEQGFYGAREKFETMIDKIYR